ncbi:MAG: DUF58 domain-containing protein [Candidatus Melainabacteria bacterium]
MKTIEIEKIEYEVNPILSGLKLVFLRNLLRSAPGELALKRKGEGSEIYSLRDYIPGQDDTRSIDWNSVARTGQILVRDYRVQANLKTYLLIDSSGSMKSKKTKLLELIYMFTKLTTEFDEISNGISLHWGHDQVIGSMPVPRKRGIARFVLNQIQSLETEGESNLAELISSINKIAARKSLLIIVTDLIDSGKWHNSLEALCKRHNVLFIHLSALIDHSLPNLGYAYFKNPENNKVSLINCGDLRLQEEYRARSLLRANETHAYFQGHSSSLMFWKIDTDIPLSQSLDQAIGVL